MISFRVRRQSPRPGVSAGGFLIVSKRSPSSGFTTLTTRTSAVPNPPGLSATGEFAGCCPTARCGQPDRVSATVGGTGTSQPGWTGAGAAERFHRDIATTLAVGVRQRVNRGTDRYEHAWPATSGGVDRAMTVVVSLRPQQPDVGIRGILTAYWWRRPSGRQGCCRSATGEVGDARPWRRHGSAGAYCGRDDGTY